MWYYDVQREIIELVYFYFPGSKINKVSMLQDTQGFPKFTGYFRNRFLKVELNV